MRALFLVALLFAAAVVLLRRRRFDFFSVGFASAAVYYFPAVFGVAADVNLVGPFALASQEIVPRTYGILALLFVGIGVGALVHDSFARRPERGFELAGGLSTAALWATLLAGLGLLGTLADAGTGLFDPDKAEVLLLLGRWYPLWTVGASVGLLAGVASGRRVCVLVCALLLLFDVYIGFRGNAATATIGLFTWWLTRGGPRRLFARRSAGVVALGLTAGLGFFLYKGFYLAIKADAWDLVQQRVLDPEYYAEVVLYSSEPFLVTGTLNEVVDSGFAIDPAHYRGLVFSLVPFSPELGLEPTSFNDLFQPSLFPEREAGLASSFLAEAWSAGRWVGLGAIVLVWVVGLGIGSRWLASPSALTRLAAVVLMPAWAFYVHRNDLLYQLVIERRFALVLVAVVAASALVHEALRGLPRPLPAFGEREGRA